MPLGNNAIYAGIIRYVKGSATNIPYGIIFLKSLIILYDSNISSHDLFY